MPIIGGAITVHKATYTASLPWDPGFIIKLTRPTAERQSLAGTVIRQSGTKNVSTGTASYSGLVASTQAENLRTIDKNYATCFVSDGINVYEAEIDCSISEQIVAGKKAVTMEVKIVREVV